MTASSNSQDTPDAKYRGFYADLSVWTLIATNLLVMLWAIVDRWSVVAVMWVYWSQSICIIIAWFMMLRPLEQFSTKGFYENGKLIDDTLGAKRRVTIKYLFFYGWFHFFYMLVLITFGGSVELRPILLAAALFWANQVFSFFHNRSRHRLYTQKDSETKPNLGRVIRYPVARIIPMHITVIVAGAMQDEGGNLERSGSVLALFMLLKTCVDVGMYVRQLKGFTDKPSRDLDSAGPLTQLLTGKRKAGKQARQIHAQLKKMYADKHEWRTVNAADFRHLNLKYYAEKTEDLEVKGFKVLGDIQNMTLRKTNPEVNIFIRCMVDSSQTTLAGVYHIGYTGWYRLARMMGLIKAYKVIELDTEFSDGRFLCTRNADPGLTPPPQIRPRNLPANSSVPAMLREHQKRTRQYLKKHPQVRALPIRSLQDAIDSQNRQYAIMLAHRKSIPGMVLEEEMDKIAGPESQEQAQDVMYEMSKLTDSQDDAQQPEEQSTPRD